MTTWLSAKLWVVFGVVLLSQTKLFSQNVAIEPLLMEEPGLVSEDVKLKTLLLRLQKHYHVEIIFEDGLVASRRVAVQRIDLSQPLQKNLAVILPPNGLTYIHLLENTYVIIRDKLAKAENNKKDRNAVSRPSKLLTVFTPLPRAKDSGHVSEIRLEGVVSDVSGQALPGANIILKGSQKGTNTDEEGNYSLEIPDEGHSALIFSFAGYKSQEVTVGNRSVLNVKLMADESVLDEVVVVGYGTRKRSDLTGAVGTVKEDAWRERSTSSLNQCLSGRITGVNVSSNSGRPGGRANIRIRGTSSISLSNTPLYVIDGVILSSFELQNGSTPIDYINPNDVASIEVLKDASSTSIYGTRGTNGVILITTKRGRAGEGKITYNSDFSVGIAPKKLEVLNSAEFLALEELIYENAAKYDPAGWRTGTKYFNPKLKRIDPNLFDSNGNPKYNTDWQDVMFQKAFTQNHQLGFTGGNEKGTFGAFLNYRKENGIVRESWQKRYSGRFVFDSQLKSWIKVGGALTYSDQDEKQIDELGGGGITTMRQVIEAIPIIPVRYDDGNWGSNRDYPGMEGGDNPLRVALERMYFLRTQTMLGTLYANLNLTKNLQFRTAIGANVINHRRDYFAPTGLQYVTVNGDASVMNNRYNSWQFENYLTYNTEIANNHSLNAMLGVSWQHVDRFENQAVSQGFDDIYFHFNNLGLGASPQAPQSAASSYGINSYFARANYSYRSKYLLTFTSRVDGSSKFGEANRYAFFPSAAVAWRVTDESFMNNVPAISNLKIRASYGLTGNSEISPYRALAGMANNVSGTIDYGVIFDGIRNVGTGIARMSNSNLKCEKTRQIDIGFEVGLISNRVNLELDFYSRKVNNMLLDAPVPLSSGYSSIFNNLGSMLNQGVEFTVSATVIRRNKFSWNTMFNYSVNKNTVLALTGGGDIFSGATVIRVGESVGSFYGRDHLGIWSTAEAEQAKKYNLLPGDVKYRDINMDGFINDNDRTIIGKGVPDGFGTVLNAFNFKNWSLTVDFQYMYGNDVLDRSIHSAEDRQGIANSYKTVLNAWTESNQSSTIAQVRPINAYYMTNNDSHKVTDASFIRGRNLLLAYNFPALISSKLKINKLRVYASIQNFLVVTKFKGYDPEVSNSSAPFDQGFGLYDYPKPRVFMLGLNVTL